MWNNYYLPRNALIAPSKSEKGQSLMEMALVVIILLLLLAGIVDLGRLFFTWVAIRDAAQEGAVYASFCPPYGPGNGEKIQQHVKASSHYPVNLNSTSIQVSSGFVSPGVPGTEVNVTVTETNFRFIMPFIGAFTGNSVRISATAKDIALQERCP